MPIKETISSKEKENIKNSIVRSKDLLEGGVPIQLDESVVTETNCYAYSMGIMYNKNTKLRGFYNPGFTEYERIDGTEDKEMLINMIKADLCNIGIQFRVLDLEDEVELGDDEYLVKVFKADINKEIPRGDFHFIRQDKESKKWFHKLGWKRQPDIIQSDPGYEEDDDAIPGAEPGSFTTHCKDGFKYMYYPIVYLVIKES